MKNVLDPDYFDFQEDILAKLLAERRRGSPDVEARDTLGATDLAKKALSQSKMSRASGTGDSQSGGNQGP